ncbi:HlyD family efflux transporter periplasmic adaptor subunit [Lysobacter sp. HDW10]|uniref:HlyD family secretion protein n=1 Tax=Lysobacter sp. HDW10 TaxID=2714936 RepID=UPI00140DA82C|nr:HlyD family efflux transporter periplasmic adaptor subunit [Lysobacter sp. HDW10]QIK80356.1 HlyD family efflux transporter periplasmic adaptor subunit [Lysobacter sp. HDW10]
MTSALFRQEALDAKKGGWLGRISLAQPMPLWVMTSIAVIGAVSILLFLFVGSYSRRSTVIGQLVPTRGVSIILAPATGVLSQMDTMEGRHVDKGQALAVVTMPRATVEDGDTLSALHTQLARRTQGLEGNRDAQAQLLTTQASSFSAQLATARTELKQLEGEISTRKEQVRIAKETLGRFRQLRQDNYVSELQMKQQEAAYLQSVGEMQILERQATSARRGVLQLQQSLQELPAQRMASDAGFQRDLATLAQESLEVSARGALAINAPIKGTISNILAKPGQAVQLGQPLLSVLPADAQLEAELLVPSRAVGFIEPGDKVLLRYQAFPYQKFGHHIGRVARISRSALSPAELQSISGLSGNSEPLYRVTVRLARQAVTAYGRPEALRPGMLLEADILGERRSLIEWIFEPLYSVAGRTLN